MDSINALKGYDKVGSDLDTNPSLRKARNRLIIAISSLVLLTTLIIASIVFANLADESEDTREKNSSTSSDSTIKALCNATQHPNSCLSSLSPLSNSRRSDPVELFKLSLQVSMDELSKVSSVPEKLLVKVNGKGEETALRDCEGLIADAIDRVNKSIQCVGVDVGEKGLSESRISDVRTWLSAAMTDQETCSDGLEEVGSGVRDEMKVAMKNSVELVSNSLAIATKIEEIDRSARVPHHRKLLGISVI